MVASMFSDSQEAKRVQGVIVPDACKQGSIENSVAGEPRRGGSGEDFDRSRTLESRSRPGYVSDDLEQVLREQCNASHVPGFASMDVATMLIETFVGYA
jgi:hypothetical protein